MEKKAVIPKIPLFPVCITLCAVLFSSYLMFHTFSYDSANQTMVVAEKCWSDFGAHIPLIRSFSRGSNLDRMLRGNMPEYPIFPGLPIRYHYLFYFLVGLLERIGIRIDWALNIPSILGFSGLLILIVLIAWKLFKSRMVALFSVLFFLFNGSLSFLPFFRKLPPSSHVLHAIITNKTFPSFGPWDNNIVSAFWNLNIYTNQRHLAAGFAIGLAFIALLLFLEKIPVKRQVPFLLFSVPTLCLLPYFHQPMLLMVGIWIVWFMIVLPKLRIFLVLTCVIASGPVLFQLSTLTQNTPQVAWYPGYLIHDKHSIVAFVEYWFHNLGLHSVFIPIGFFLASRKIRTVMLPIVLLFIIGNSFKFSVEVAANHKFFNFCMIFGVMLTASVIVRLGQAIRKHARQPWVRILNYGVLAVFCLLCTLSGAIDFFAVINDRKIFLSDIPRNTIAAWISRYTPNSAVFLNTSYLYNPASIAGRSIFLGWPYFPWSAGYEEDRMSIMKTMYESKDPAVFCPLLTKYQISYVMAEPVTGDPDLPEIDPEYFTTLATPLFSVRDKTFSIYSTQDICRSL